jgi:hypothetical protein
MIRFSPTVFTTHPSTSVSPSIHSTDCSTRIIFHHPRWYNRPNSGRPNRWIQSHPTPRKRIITKLKRLFKETSEKLQKLLLLAVGISVEIRTGCLLSVSYEPSCFVPLGVNIVFTCRLHFIIHYMIIKKLN